MSAERVRPALDDPDAYVLYRYVPSREAAIVFVVVFAITTFLHIFQVVKKRTWYFIPMVVGGLFETIGYVGRVLGHSDQWALGPFIMQSLLTLVAPALFAASIYIILGRVILMTDGERYSLIRQKWLTKLFVTGDVLSFMTQGSGGGIMSAGANGMKLGEKIVIAGLFIQIFVFGFFIVVAGLFHYRLMNDKPSRKLGLPAFSKKSRGTQAETPASSTVNVDDLPWKKHLYVLYAASALIMVRSIFRVIEYVQGNAGYLLRNEVFLYIFDAVLMFIAMVLFNWIHPSEVTDIYLRRKAEENTSDVELQQQYLNRGEETDDSFRGK